MERDKKIGLGAAYISGFNWGLENKYDYFFQMDCDFSHDPNDLKRLHNVISNNEADMVVGSRYKGVNVVNWPMSRVLLSYFASKYVRFSLELKLLTLLLDLMDTKKKIWKTLILEKSNLWVTHFKLK